MIGKLFCKLFGHKRRVRLRELDGSKSKALRCPRCGDIRQGK